MTDPANEPRPVPPVTLAVIRLAILLGVLTLGGVAWYVTRQPDWRPSPDLDPTPFFYASLGVWAVTAAGLVLLWQLWRREADPRRRATLMIVGWALGEVPAVWGGVYYLLTRDPQRYLTGLMFLVLAFLLLPLRAAR